MQKITPYHAKYFAHELTKRISSDNLAKLSSTLSNAQVDLNPHQIEAALFAFKSPLSMGAILADEVGLGKTIEAGLVLSQKWAENKKHILLIVPSSLRKQWNQELIEKFFLPSIILESKSFNKIIKDGNLNPLLQSENIVICSYHFAKAKASYIAQTPFDLVVIDEAHRLRNVYKTSSKIARIIKQSIQNYPKLLLTATPLQNSLLELYGLVSIIDEHIFGDLPSFKSQYAKVESERDIFSTEEELEPSQSKFAELRERIKPICIRTLRKQVVEYIDYKSRLAITKEYSPTKIEHDLYNKMSGYLQRSKLYALPASQRQLMTMILRKLLASSSYAIASTLDGLANKLQEKYNALLISLNPIEQDLFSELAENFESLEVVAEEWVDDEESENGDDKVINKQILTADDLPLIKMEIIELQEYAALAHSVFQNAKGDSLLLALKDGFSKARELGSLEKVVIFTESRITQNYLLEFLSNHGYQDDLVLFNGSNTDAQSKDIYNNWLIKNKDSDKVSGSKTADMRSALVEYFRDSAKIMLATEAAAEGINLQFCSLVINYDLPWNPQRIEQRIGRCHRYGQKHDVVVINFLNTKNAADKRVYELLEKKFKLFEGVFGASDEVLGVIASGVDFEKRIASIYQSCRTDEEIKFAFDNLRNEMENPIKENMKIAKTKLLENFDVDVHARLKFDKDESEKYLSRYESYLWDLTRYSLGSDANFDDSQKSFTLNRNPFPGEHIPAGPYKLGKNITDAHIYRPSHPLAKNLINISKSANLNTAELIFNYSHSGMVISPLKSLIGKSGIMRVSQLTVQSFEAEDHLLCAGFDSNLKPIEGAILARLFEIPAQVISPCVIEEDQGLTDLENLQISDLTQSIISKNSQFFDHEVGKLDAWAEDIKKSLELELKRIDIDIKSEKTRARKLMDLTEKIKAQKNINTLEKKRNQLRQQLFSSQDEVDQKKDHMLTRIEADLNQKTTITPLFTIRFRVE